MKLAVILGTCLALASPAWAQSDRSKNTETHDTRPEPPMMGKHLAKGHARPEAGRNKVSPNLTYHNGPVLTQTQGARVIAIMWGASWTGTDGKVSGLDAFYSGVGGSAYLGSNTEYTQAGGAHVGTKVSYGGHLVDNSAAPSGAPQTSAILNEVCKVLQVNHITPVTNGYYPVYVDTKRGNAGYCAWHSWGSCAGVQRPVRVLLQPRWRPRLRSRRTHRPAIRRALPRSPTSPATSCPRRFTDPARDWLVRPERRRELRQVRVDLRRALRDVPRNNTVWKIQGNWSNNAYDLNLGLRRRVKSPRLHRRRKSVSGRYLGDAARIHNPGGMFVLSSSPRPPTSSRRPIVRLPCLTLACHAASSSRRASALPLPR